MILAKLNITQQQALDLLAHMEVIEELLITGITEKEAEPHVMTTAQREAIAVDANIVSSQCAHIAKNLIKL